MNKKVKPLFWTVLVVLVGLGIISSMIAMFSMIELLSGFKIVFGGAYFLFLPGFIISYIFFKRTKDPKANVKKKGVLTWLERVALSIGISLVLVPVVVFYLSLIGIQVNIFNSFLTTLGIILICTVILIYQVFKKGKK
jgi:uncharacterized membrane protein